MRVAFFNELDTYAELQGLNTGDIIAGVCLDARIVGLQQSFLWLRGLLPAQDTRQLRANFAGVPTGSSAHCGCQRDQDGPHRRHDPEAQSRRRRHLSW